MSQLQISTAQDRRIRDSDSVVETRELRWEGLLPWMACLEIGGRALDWRFLSIFNFERVYLFIYPTPMHESTSAINPRPERD